MNAHFHYEKLIERARHRILDGYVEKHHVIPRCMGGRDSRANVVQLTAEEHYVAHQLLVTMHPANFGLVWAAMAMTNGANRNHRGNNKRYGWLRRKFALAVSARFKGKKLPPETCAKLSAAHMGKSNGPHSEATKAKMSLASKGRLKSETHRAALAKAKIGNTNATGKRSEETCENIRHSLQGLTFRQKDTYRATMRGTMKEIWAQRRAGHLPMPKHNSVPAGG